MIGESISYMAQQSAFYLQRAFLPVRFLLSLSFRRSRFPVVADFLSSPFSRGVLAFAYGPFPQIKHRLEKEKKYSEAKLDILAAVTLGMVRFLLLPGTLPGNPCAFARHFRLLLGNIHGLSCFA